MLRASLAILIALATSACAYRPTPTEVVRIVDSPADVQSVCQRLGEVSGTIPTIPGFATATEIMLQQTVALGGTDLLLEKHSDDWLLVRGIAYRCNAAPIRDTVVRAAG